MNKYCPPARIAKKMEEINNFQQEPDENLYQAWERFKELLMKCHQHYLTEMQEVILFYNGLGIPTRQILNSKGAIPSKTAADAKVAIQEMAEYSQKWHNGTSSQEGGYRAATLRFYQRNNLNPSYQERRQSMEDILSKFMSESAKRHEENLNLIKEIQASTDAAIPYSEASQSIPQKEKDPGSFTLPCFINNVCFDNALVDLGDNVSVMPISTYLNLGLGELAHTKLTVELADMTVKYPKGIAKNVLVMLIPFEQILLSLLKLSCVR
ncbi:hypothetical protein Tco_0294370 [Tanacetum coccineum]